MTPPAADYERLLRRALQAAADPVEPTGDGLDKIQRRLAEPWLKREAWHLRHLAGNAGWLLRVRGEELAGQAGALLAQARARALARAALAGPWRARFRSLSALIAGPASSRAPAHAERSRVAAWLGPGVAWLRSAIAVVGAVAAVTAGVYALGQLRQAVVPATQSSGNSPTPAPASSSPSARRHSPTPGPAGLLPLPTRSARRHHRSAPAPTCSPSAQPSPKPSPSKTATPSPSPTGSVSASPSPTPVGVANGGMSAGHPAPGASRSCATAAASLPTR